MKRLVLLILPLFFVLVLSAKDSDYLMHVEFDPDHLHIQKDGKITVTFNLPQLDLVKEAYISVRKDTLIYYIIPTTRMEGEDLKAVENEMTFTGSDIVTASDAAPFMTRSFVAAGDDEDILPDEDTEQNDEDSTAMPDDDTEIPDSDTISSLEDGTYAAKLVVVLDTTGDNNPPEEDDEDSIYNEENDEDDTGSDEPIPPSVTHTFTIVIDSVPPAALKELTAEGSNKSISVYMTPSSEDINGKDGEKIGTYIVTVQGIFMKDGAETRETLTYRFDTTEDSRDTPFTATIKGKDGYELINNDNDEDKYRYLITVQPEDLAGNTDNSTGVSVMASAMTTYGFWNNYKHNGGVDDGGHCFIATASFGDYFRPRVVILRQFRDSILAQTEIGRDIISIYYRYSPPLARVIAHTPILRPFTRFILLPLILTAVLLTHPSVLFLLLCIPLLFFIRRRFSIRISVLIFFTIIGGTVTLPQTLSAAEVHGEVLVNNSLFLPEKIDDSALGTPFRDIAGTSNRYMGGFILGFDMPIPEKAHIRVTLRGGMSFTFMTGHAIRSDGKSSADKTRFYFYPLTAEVKVRPDYSFPLYPYATFGFDYTFWWINESGSLAQAGGTSGFHGSFGIQLSLNWMDKNSARGMKKYFGIRDTMLYAHFRLERMDDFGTASSWDLTDSRFEFGLLFEF